MAHILGIDPGTTESAWVLYNPETRRIDGHGQDPNDCLYDVIKTAYMLKATIAIEHLQCFGMAVGHETFETAYFIGRMSQYLEGLGGKVYRLYRSDVKMAICYTMKATDKNIRQAVIDMLGNVGTKKHPGPLFGIANDQWSALAVALTAEKQKAS